MDRFAIISGCSGGGKSTLVAELARRGHCVVEEPGRRIIAEQRALGSEKALPWVDPAAFARRAIAMAFEDRQAALHMAGRVFFDRGLIDAAAGLEHATGEPAIEGLCRQHRYHGLVFLTPPWTEIFGNDDMRRHGMAEAVAEYDRLLGAYARLGYEIAVLPKVSVSQRADFILERLG